MDETHINQIIHRLKKQWPDPKPAIAVDTHDKRVAGRLGLRAAKNPAHIEKELNDAVQKDQWCCSPIYWSCTADTPAGPAAQNVWRAAWEVCVRLMKKS